MQHTAIEFAQKTTPRQLHVFFALGLRRNFLNALPVVLSPVYANMWSHKSILGAAVYCLLSKEQKQAWAMPGPVSLDTGQSNHHSLLPLVDDVLEKDMFSSDDFRFYDDLHLTHDQERMIPYYYVVAKTMKETNTYGQRADIQHLVTMLMGNVVGQGEFGIIPLFEATVLLAAMIGQSPAEHAFSSDVYTQVCLAFLTGHSMSSFHRDEKTNRTWMIHRFHTTMDYNFPMPMFRAAAFMTEGASNKEMVAHYLLANKNLVDCLCLSHQELFKNIGLFAVMTRLEKLNYMIHVVSSTLRKRAREENTDQDDWWESLYDVSKTYRPPKRHRKAKDAEEQEGEDTGRKV